MTTDRRLVVASLPLLAVGAALAVVVADGQWSLDPVQAFAVIACVRAVDIYASFRLQPKEQTYRFQLGEAVFVVAAVLLAPGAAVLAPTVGLLAGLVAARVPLAKIAPNVGLELVPVALGIWAVQAVGGSGPDLGSSDLLAAGLGALVYFVTGGISYGLTMMFVTRRRFLDLLGLSSFMLVQFVCAVGIGLLSGAASRMSLFVPLLALPPIAMVQVVLTEHFRARRDRERIDGLFHAAQEAHGSVLTDEVEHALYRAVARLLHRDSARVSTLPPTGQERGVALQLSDGTSRWLVVDTASGPPMEDEDVRLLETLGAVGASALENARLVEEIRQQAIQDPVTGLANQILFQDRVSQAATNAWRMRERFAVVMLDIDAFKKVNDSLGHSNGNELLRTIGDRLGEAVREVDTAARLGSDHFTILLPGIGTPQTAGVMAAKLLQAVRQPLVVGGQELFMTASAGIAFFPEDGTHAEHLLRNADSAMHRAKNLGDSYQIYSAGMNEQAHLRLARESELHNALRRGELRVRYQPQIDLRTGHIVGVEALVRWEHPVLGLIGPIDFVPLAEESGLIVEVDEWVLRAACRQGIVWREEGLPAVRVAVNLSGRHFQSDRILTTLQSALATTRFDARCLEIEVTEGIAVGETDDTIEVLDRVRELGIQIAIDDFGTGYSMLGRLQRFPIDRIKIDRTFVSEITSVHGEAPIVAAMIAMARSLRLEVVAEGVETLEQQTFLRLHGCDQAQGFLFSHPVEADEISRLLRTPSVGFNVTSVS